MIKIRWSIIITPFFSINDFTKEILSKFEMVFKKNSVIFFFTSKIKGSHFRFFNISPS